MPKKKRKKPHRRPTRPAGAPSAEATRPDQPERAASLRAERKEQARRERERRIKQARRRQRIRRATRWGIAAGVAALIGGGVYAATRESRELQEEAALAAERLGCSEIETKQDEVDAAAAMDSATLHSPPFAQGQNGIPATAGPHSNPLPPDDRVYAQSIPEANAVHNLEHGYVIIYYSDQGDRVLPDDLRSELENLAEDEQKVLMAPYPGLANTFDLVAWGKLQTCDPPEDAEPEDAVTVARAFIDRFRSGGLAPEPQGV